MFQHTTLIFFLLLISLSGCSLNENKIDEEKVQEEKIDTTNKTVFGSDHQIGTCQNLILEITTERYGVYPTGRVLDIRVLKDGRVEYDSYKTGIYESPIIRKTIYLSKKHLTKIKHLISTFSLEHIKGKYAGHLLVGDVYLEKRISYCDNFEKYDILLNEYDVQLAKDRKDKIPPNVIQLVKLIDTINNAFIPSIESEASGDDVTH